jgi:hypothetical protein
MGKPVVYKTKVERVRESVEILRKLKDLGVSVSEPGYVATKQLLDTWIAEGETREERIEFPRYGRRLDLVLPAREGRAVQAVFRVVDSRLLDS